MNGGSVLTAEKVRRLEAFPQLLKKLASTFDSVHMNLRACVPRLSLSGTPEEVILSVFHLACTDAQSVVDILRVCKRFRRIALSSSRLWIACPLTLDMPSHIIGMIASRSGSHGLTVRFETVRPRFKSEADAPLKLSGYSAKWNAVECTPFRDCRDALQFYIKNQDSGF